jgi:cell division protein ZapA (FtsZ GTPase activity inhibitor)
MGERILREGQQHYISIKASLNTTHNLKQTTNYNNHNSNMSQHKTTLASATTAAAAVERRSKDRR